MADAGDDIKKTHRPRQAGKKAEKKKQKAGKDGEHRNPKAFAIQSVNKAARQVRRGEDLEAKKHHVPLVDRTPVEPPPVVVCVVGPPKVGKTTLIQNLIKNYTREKINDIKGPVTVVSGKKQRLTFIECPNNINYMIDVAKVADLVLLLIDASFGFEMEIFEFLNIAQVHGFPKIMGVLTHLDLLKKNKSMQKIKKTLKQRFWTEVYQGAKLFYLSNITHGLYPKTEVTNLARFISVMKFRPLAWRTSHPYLLVDRFEDVTNPDIIQKNEKCDRTICLYGYMRGAHMKNNCKIHVMGCGDYSTKAIHALSDPCPLPDKLKKRSLTEKEKLVFAPMSGVGGIVYDKDAVYIDLGGSKAGKRAASGNQDEEEEDTGMMSSLVSVNATLDDKMEASGLNIFKNSKPITADNVEMDSKWTMPAEEVMTDSNGVVRRKAVFSDSNGDLLNDDDDDDEDEDEEEDVNSDDDVDDEEANEKIAKRLKAGLDGDLGTADSSMFEDDDEDEDEDSEDDDEEMDGVDDNNDVMPKIVKGGVSTSNIEEWKMNFKSKLSGLSNLSKRADIRNVVYGDIQKDAKDEENSSSEEEEDLIAGLFQSMNKSAKKKGEKKIFHQQDCSQCNYTETKEAFDELDNLIASIKDCFTTKLSKMNLDDDEDMFGDFEDLENGDGTGGDGGDEDFDDVDSGLDSDEGDDDDGNDGDKKDAKSDPEKKMSKIAAKKRKLKHMFDADYDEEKGGNTYLEDLKNAVSQQAELNQKEFENMEDDIRVQYEGYRAGLYTQIELENIPCEFVTNFDPTIPVIIGGLLTGEDNIGYIQTRFKKHRWHERILKNRDPLILSAGWRRFQTIPLYSMQDHNGRYRSLKYTPEHLHCVATMYGPVVPPSSGVLAIQNNSKSKFKIAATGVVLDMDKSIEVVKKLKLVGTPLKVFKNTAFIKGMFTSQLEVAKFEGGAIRTVSGIRGQIKKAIKAPPGAFRATFEDKILMSDIIFCRTWYPITCPQLYNPVQSLLLPKDQKDNWQGMRTVGQLRQLNKTKPAVKKDSLYKPIERQERKFNKLTIPKKLQADLPFKSKPKNETKQKKKTYEQKRAVIMEPDEKRAVRLMKGIFAVNKEKQRKLKAKRQEQHTKFIKKMGELEQKRDVKIKEQRKRIYRILGQEEKRKQKQMEKGGGGKKRK